MSTVVKDLGAVSAYAYAVEQGYTGTEAEYAELMADYAEVGQRAQDAQQAIEDMSVSATTLAEGESATVTKTEQDGVVHLEFGIPRGATGAKGERGLTGATGATGATPNLTIGTVTTLEPDASATATITGTAENPVLNLGLPKGQTGEAGGGDDAFFVVEVTTNWWTDPPSKTANCTWSELAAADKPILWNGQIAQKYSDMSGGRIAYIAPSFSYGASSYEVYELVFEATGYEVTENYYRTSVDTSSVLLNIAYPYSEYQTYNVGDLVIYIGEVWRCLTAVSTPEGFNLSKWARTNIAVEITALANALANINIADLIGNSEGAAASKAYSVGDVLLHDGKLYKVTASIAQGFPIVPNTNCTQTTVIDLLRGV